MVDSVTFTVVSLNSIYLVPHYLRKNKKNIIERTVEVEGWCCSVFHLCVLLLFSLAGSTDGIGKAYAEELAKRGVNVILVSRSKEKLEAVSRSISETYNVETDFIVADFSKGRELYPAIKEALKDREIGILVNNVGIFYDYTDYFTNLSEDMLWDLIHINIASATMMTHIVLPGMVKKKKGAIVNLSSAVCCHPTPMYTVYGATKVSWAVVLNGMYCKVHYRLVVMRVFLNTFSKDVKVLECFLGICLNIGGE